MKTFLRIVGALVIIVVIAFAGWRYYVAHRARAAGIVSQNITHDGDTWTADMQARLPAPLDAVYNAMADVQNLHSSQIKAVRVVSQNGNTKVVDMDLNGPGDQLITTRLQFDYDPVQHQINYHTVESPMLQTDAHYSLTDDGSSNTLITLHETTKFATQLPVPDGVIKDVISQIFVAQLEGIKQTLHIQTADQSDKSDDEF
jgi:Polyketide cyclase / dehydrase and lipid transport